jgi:hypothetical protein
LIAAALNALAGLVLAVNGQTYSCAGQTFEYLKVTGSDITVTDCRIRESGVGTNAVSVYGDRNTLRRLTVERSGATGVYFFSGTGNVLEDSMIRDPVRRPGWDSWGIYSAANGTVTIRRNTVYGSGFSTSAPGGSSVIEDNHFVVPDDYRTDCKGNSQPGGPCQCAEFGVALKTTAGSVIRRNLISGYRKADPVCGGSGTPGAGISIDACGPDERPCPTPNVTVDYNLINNSHDGIYVGPGATGLVIEANRICFSDSAISDGFGNPSKIIDNRFAGNRVDLNLYGSRVGPVTGNRTLASPAECL